MMPVLKKHYAMKYFFMACLGSVLVWLSSGCCVGYYYQYRISSALKEPLFPDQSPSIPQHSFYDAFTRAVRRLQDNDHRDRWGNYPVRYGAMDYMSGVDEDLDVLSRRVEAGPTERIKRKALQRLLYFQSFDAEHRLSQGRPLRAMGKSEVDRLMRLVRSTDHDDTTLRTQALRILGATGRPEAIPVLLKSTKASPSRVSKAAYKGLISIAQIEPFGSRDDIRAALLNLLANGDDQERIMILDSLPELTHRKGLWLGSGTVMQLLDDDNPQIVAGAIRFMATRDEPKAENAIIKLAMSETPLLKRLATAFLEKTRHLTADDLVPLSKSDRLADRVVVLRICSSRMRKWHPESYRRILRQFCGDENDKLATAAKARLNHFINQPKRYREACINRDELYKQVFDPPRKTKSKKPVDHAAIQLAMKARYDKQLACIKKAQELFPISPKSTVRTPIYQTLVDHFANPKRLGIIVVPDAKAKGGLKTDASKRPILTQEELITLREDHGYDGPTYTLTEIFLDKATNEAWVQLAVRFGPLAGQGMGVVLKKVDGKWTITKQTPLWRS